MKQADENRSGTRREFVRAGLRYSLMAGLAALAAVLFERSGGKLTGQTCVNRGICHDCGAFKQCGLPQALSAKAAGRGGVS